MRAHIHVYACYNIDIGYRPHFSGIYRKTNKRNILRNRKNFPLFTICEFVVQSQKKRYELLLKYNIENRIQKMLNK